MFNKFRDYASKQFSAGKPILLFGETGSGKSTMVRKLNEGFEPYFIESHSLYGAEIASDMLINEINLASVNNHPVVFSLVNKCLLDELIVAGYEVFVCES